MTSLKTASSWLALFALACAAWFLASSLFNSRDLATAYTAPGLWGACLFAVACSVFNPPAWPKGK